MNPLLTSIFSVLAVVMLFLHGFAAFSEDIARLGGERLRGVLRRLTRTDWRGVLRCGRRHLPACGILSGL